MMFAAKILVAVVLSLCYSALVNADILMLKDGYGQTYQIDGSIRVENGVRFSKIRWPDNRVNTIRVTSCGQKTGVIYMYDASGKKYIEAIPWNRKGSMLVDRVATIVCKNSP